MHQSTNRRRFLNTAASIVVGAPAVLTSKRTAAQGVIGEGVLKFHCQHDSLKLPSKYHWQVTHGVAVDPNNHLYVIHQGNASIADHPSIFVFDSEGTFIRAFGEQFQGGGHGLDIRVEDGTPYLYVAGYQGIKSITKLTLTGGTVWQKYAPTESGLYAEGEATKRQPIWGRDRFMPTNIAFLSDGQRGSDFLVADGYGSYNIHRYDADGQWLSCFGGPGPGRGTFNLPHGIWIDDRDSDNPQIVVADRAHNDLQTFSIDGTYRKTVTGFGLPSNIDTHGDLMLVPEFVARVSILDKDHNTLATIGNDQQRILADKQKNQAFTIQRDPSRWQQGKFVHPHDGCFDELGNIYIAEWVASGRVTKLTPA